MGQPIVHFEIIGQDPQKLRSFYGDLFGWKFDTSATVAEPISDLGNYGFVNRNTTDDGVGIPGGVGGGPNYHSHAIFYVGVPQRRNRARKGRAPRGDACDGSSEEPG